MTVIHLEVVRAHKPTRLQNLLVRWRQSAAELDRLEQAIWQAQEAGERPSELEARFERLSAQNHFLRCQVALLSARSLDDLMAKAEVIAWCGRGANPEIDGSQEGLTASIIMDLLISRR